MSDIVARPKDAPSIFFSISLAVNFSMVAAIAVPSLFRFDLWQQFFMAIFWLSLTLTIGLLYLQKSNTKCLTHMMLFRTGIFLLAAVYASATERDWKMKLGLAILAVMEGFSISSIRPCSPQYENGNHIALIGKNNYFVCMILTIASIIISAIGPEIYRWHWMNRIDIWLPRIVVYLFVLCLHIISYHMLKGGKRSTCCLKAIGLLNFAIVLIINAFISGGHDVVGAMASITFIHGFIIVYTLTLLNEIQAHRDAESEKLPIYATATA